MPQTVKEERNAYNKAYYKANSEKIKTKLRQKREIKYNKYAYDSVMKELNKRSVLPVHIYNYREVMKEMLKNYFKKRIIVRRNRTELITQSYGNI